MEGCSLDSAYSTGAYASAGCLDTRTAEISRRQEKKKARKCRGSALTYLNGGMNMVGAVDPDRPSQKRMESVPQMNSKTGLTQHQPVEQQYEYESFVGGMDDLPAIRNDVVGPTGLQTSLSSSFFGVNPADDGTSAMPSKKTFIEGFSSSVAPYVDVIGEDETYTLKPDFTKTFSLRGTQKAGGSDSTIGPSPTSQETSYLTPTDLMPSNILPIPNVDTFWKENGVSGGQSSFFSHLRAPGGHPSGSEVNQNTQEDVPASRHEVLEKLDRIFARLDDMESQKSENSQTEVLLFILTGLGVIFLMDIGCRVASIAK